MKLKFEFRLCSTVCFHLKIPNCPGASSGPANLTDSYFFPIANVSKVVKSFSFFSFDPQLGTFHQDKFKQSVIAHLLQAEERLTFDGCPESS